jgi:multidrug resistance protein, MATE family
VRFVIQSAHNGLTPVRFVIQSAHTRLTPARYITRPGGNSRVAESGFLRARGRRFLAEARPELLATARLGAPLVLAELGWMAMGLVDTAFVGHVSAEALAGVSLGSILFYGVAICSSGVLLGMDTFVSRAFGAGDREECRAWLWTGAWLAAGLVPLVMGCVALLEPMLQATGIDPAVLRTAGPYVRALNWSTPPLFLYFVLRRYLQAIHVVRPVMFALVSANLVNLAGNWVLVLGNLGAPRMGAEGSGWATCISRVYMAGVLVAVVIWQDRGEFQARQWPVWPRIAELARLGVPAAGQMGLEIGVFAVVTLLIGRLNAVQLAGHQIALGTVSTTYMIPLGISSAAAVRVGHALGRGDPAAAARSGWTALGLGAVAMSAAAIVLLTVPRWIARIFTVDAGVIASAVVLLRVAAFFQLFDGLQVVATGALRGVGDTRMPMLSHFAGYWLIGLPVGSVLCFRYGLGAAGLWAGLSLGLILIGIALALWWWRTARTKLSVVR